MLAFPECAWGTYDGEVTSLSCLNLLQEMEHCERKRSWTQDDENSCRKYKVGIHNSGLWCVLMSETRQSCYLSGANMERFKWKMNSNYKALRLSYHCTISLLKWTWKKISVKSMSTDKTEYIQMTKGWVEAIKSIDWGLITVVQVIYCRLEHRFKMKHTFHFCICTKLAGLSAGRAWFTDLKNPVQKGQSMGS